MREIKDDAELVARCGLYCGTCGAYLKEKCSGCAGDEKAGWRKAHSCSKERGYRTCAECTDFNSFEDCGKIDNFISKVISLFTHSDRPASLRRIKEIGCAAYASEMAAARSHAVRK